MNVPRTFAILAFGVAVSACGPADLAPVMTDGVPIVDRQGEIVGTADPDDFDEAVSGGREAAVYRDRELVGHFGSDGFVPDS